MIALKMTNLLVFVCKWCKIELINLHDVFMCSHTYNFRFIHIKTYPRVRVIMYLRECVCSSGHVCMYTCVYVLQCVKLVLLFSVCYASVHFGSNYFGLFKFCQLGLFRFNLVGSIWFNFVRCSLHVATKLYLVKII